MAQCRPGAEGDGAGGGVSKVRFVGKRSSSRVDDLDAGNSCPLQVRHCHIGAGSRWHLGERLGEPLLACPTDFGEQSLPGTTRIGHGRFSPQRSRG